ncbi:outer membrane protein assembly factor BamE [Hymenobacter humi]|uniref:Outer membrane protein assembly factor BamE n=1 Tax=Hymenobacter humi TaxID=1411620 RepID=A0ABW2U3N0_9BACT
MKILLRVGLVAGVVLLGLFLNFELRARNNEQKVRTLRNGMSAEQVTAVMGRPYRTQNSYFEGQEPDTYMYLYHTSFGGSGDIEIYIARADNKVFRIVTNN